jgi:hypothetical protein
MTKGIHWDGGEQPVRSRHYSRRKSAIAAVHTSPRERRTAQLSDGSRQVEETSGSPIGESVVGVEIRRFYGVGAVE